MNVVVGITGGIAAYKAVGVVRALVLAGHDVHVVPTEAALRFVGRPTLEAISRNPVHTDLYEGVAEVRHVAIGQAADLIVIAPATANSIAKLANGLGDDLLGNTVLASEAPVVIAPAMHTEMWRHPATQANVATLAARGVTIVGPAVGQLTGSDSGPGRMAEPETIVRAALAVVGETDASGERGATGAAARDLEGRRVVVTAGGTREPLDPVRFLGNRSSGKQGVAVAEAARARGASVTLIAANLETSAPAGCDVRHVSTALELRDAVREAAAGADAVVMAAAVADYRPAAVSESKLKKSPGDAGLTLELVRNPDILAELGHAPHAGTVLVGFAAETEPDDARRIALGREKREAKGADVIVVNRVGWNEGFAADDNRATVVGADGTVVTELHGTKVSVAHGILDVILPILSSSEPTDGHPARTTNEESDPR
ncbi:bifunctional phosphopantothenoylcysteine decarboxylase/phosphopantothenate--cysteine ligase CoaBC [Agromyces aerolatus]|uniref:bifunctional phosphopantothenoylcysteine decarboxylase/phosphopantothenate--cysteine ligase CoaBC n=1 Tax=Agromyces sp. LY-1074 TaxID=3074080 RepID=UPI00286424DD|nr:MULTISPECIES: bifunctional phosphopantothenoylcysteine decarboxylase/phosphopantothenate--cysteine ligase CoaBC [unclassified Agromyces]MDR5700635.1 bifunctional phosphopantothenoylcysteine decarboxylase/phosphopantothenate--cysteine ligase CoaBC [Agromyces sp. LY-1074]MDR5707156.1 bifunctional phosphopantothenoylcysteine decarboxylase/phosphopantothenate--cysteine ligase CoaBC [Agromyces sp. LY-1358]